MAQTIEAEIDEQGNVRLLEPVHLTKPTRALVTLLEDRAASAPAKATAAGALAFLRANRLPEAARPTTTAIDAQIEEERNAWE